MSIFRTQLNGYQRTKEAVPTGATSLSQRSQVRGYQPGDEGTVLEGPASYAGDAEQSYVMVMDKDGPGHTSIIFRADEIEPIA